jgi:hypothetical protein
MGDSTIACCNACGYATPLLMTGGGMHNFRTFDARPVLCPTCREVTTANMKAALPVCLKCGEGATSAVPWPGPSVCPKCGESHLYLKAGGLMWD